MSDFDYSQISLEEARAYAMEHGISLNKTERESLNENRTIIRDDWQSYHEQLHLHREQAKSFATRWIEAFNRNYPKFLDFLLRAGDVVMTLMQTVIVALGNPLILLFLLGVEHERVRHGIALFESTSNLATFGAWAIVLLNLTLEFTIHYVEAQAGYKHDTQKRFSFKLLKSDLQYLLGSGDWHVRELSPAQPYRKLSRLVTTTILILALAGSMREAIAQKGSLVWYESLWSIAADSSLLEMSTWLSGLIFAFAAVVGVQKTASYIAVKCAEIVEVQRNYEPAFTIPPIPQDELDRLEIEMLVTKVNRQREKREGEIARLTEELSQVQVANQQLRLQLTPYPKSYSNNGNGSHDFLGYVEE